MKLRELRRIGSGGFGEVLECQDEWGARYAMKRLLSDDPQGVERFLREMRILKTLRHPNIIPVIRTSSEAPPYYYLMPLMRGSLESRMAEIRADWGWKVAVVGQVMDAIEYAHDQGVLHRDLTPGNILFDVDGTAVVSDFGLGRRIDAGTVRKTQTGMGLGTHFYSAPEQFYNAKEANQTADVYSIGAIIYSLFAETHLPGVMDVERLPEGLRYVVGKAIRGDATRRYASVADLRRDFEVAAGLVENRRPDDEVSRVSMEFLANRHLADVDVQSLVQALRELIPAPDALHEQMMKIPTGLTKRLLSRHRDEMRDVIRAFARHFSSSKWPFSYCDRICDVVTDLAREAVAADTVADLLVGLVKMGVLHNRFYVLRRAAELLHEVPEDGIGFSVRDGLLELSPEVVEGMRDYVNMGKLVSPLRFAFERVPPINRG
jgi:hypothetical protein